MEQKKTLWIIAGVGIFLLVVLGAALIFYKPNYQPSLTVTKNVPVEKTNNAGWSNPQGTSVQSTEIQRPDFGSAVSTSKVNDMIVVADNATVVDVGKNSSESITAPAQATTIDLNELKRGYASSEPATQTQQNINITVNIPEKESSVAPVVVTSDYYINTTNVADASSETKSSSTPVQKVEKAAQKNTQKNTGKSDSPKTEAPAQTTKTTTATTKTTVTTAPKTTASKTVTRYWVQVAAYTNKKTAENARSVLTDNKIPSDIFTYQDAKNRLFYRVRVGPYTTKAEAEYWQSKILKIEDFKNSQSYVTSTTD
ncbi:MAG: SPOR domain-containing protein [Treponema sp.]|nr:SPOR domain-containing protein [Treponema sp.]